MHVFRDLTVAAVLVGIILLFIVCHSFKFIVNVYEAYLMYSGKSFLLHILCSIKFNRVCHLFYENFVCRNPYFWTKKLIALLWKSTNSAVGLPQNADVFNLNVIKCIFTNLYFSNQLHVFVSSVLFVDHHLWSQRPFFYSRHRLGKCLLWDHRLPGQPVTLVRHTQL